MVKLIVGSRGTGKTTQMVEMINESVKTASGNIVCIEKGMKLTYNLDHKCRLIDMDEYAVAGYDRMYGFVAGLLAGNYDIEAVYVDGVLKVLNHDLDALGKLLEDLHKLSDSVKFCITVSADASELPDSVKKFA